jgi:predicted phage terminase large subunit-like protein
MPPANQLPNPTEMTRDEKIAWIAKEKAKAMIKGRNSLLGFTQYTFAKYQVNWHHAVICQYLEQLRKGEIKRLLIFTPPRHGKSELVSRRFPAYSFGRNPNEQIISASYSDDLASRMNRDTQRIIDSKEYRELFPLTNLYGKNVRSVGDGSYLRNSDIFEIVGHKGVYRSAGIRTGITGMGFTLGLIDDPFKDRKEADSKTIRQSVWDWFTSVFMTRAEKDARVCITQTRWHKDDLSGRILEMIQKGSQEPWTVLNLPAIIEDDDLNQLDPMDTRELGEALWPGKYDLDRLAEIKQTIGSRDWAALYQQRPTVEGGNIIQRAWWQYYESPPARFDEVIQSWDLTFKKTDAADYVVGQVWGRKGADKYLLDQVRAQMGFVDTVRAIHAMARKWPQAHRKLIEDKANGSAVIDAIKKEVMGVIPVQPEGGKESRAHAVSPQIEAGNVHLPKWAPWVQDYVEEWANFPNGKNDDMVDSTTQALNHLGGSGVARLEKLLEL